MLRDYRSSRSFRVICNGISLVSLISHAVLEALEAKYGERCYSQPMYPQSTLR